MRENLVVPYFENRRSRNFEKWWYAISMCGGTLFRSSKKVKKRGYAISMKGGTLFRRSKKSKKGVPYFDERGYAISKIKKKGVPYFDERGYAISKKIFFQKKFETGKIKCVLLRWGLGNVWKCVSFPLTCEKEKKFVYFQNVRACSQRDQVN